MRDVETLADDVCMLTVAYKDNHPAAQAAGMTAPPDLIATESDLPALLRA